MSLLISWVYTLCMENLLQQSFTVMKNAQMESNSEKVDKFDNNILLKYVTCTTFWLKFYHI